MYDRISDISNNYKNIRNLTDSPKLTPDLEVMLKKAQLLTIFYFFVCFLDPGLEICILGIF